MVTKSCGNCIYFSILGDPSFEDYPEDNNFDCACMYELNDTSEYWQNDGENCPFWQDEIMIV